MAESWNDDAYYYDDYYDQPQGRTWSTLALILSGVLGILIGFGCAACLGGGVLIYLLTPAESTSGPVAPPPESVATVPAPTPLAALPQPSNPQPQPPAAGTFVSGGLGLSQSEWEGRYGLGQPGEAPGYMWYSSNQTLVGFQEGNVWYLQRQWVPENPITLEAARAQSGELMPNDRQFIQTYSPEGRPDLVVDVYRSPALAGRFTQNWWAGAEPGTFMATFSVSEFGVSQMIVALGNNP